MSDQSQNEPPEEQPRDTPAALEPDAAAESPTAIQAAADAPASIESDDPGQAPTVAQSAAGPPPEVAAPAPPSPPAMEQPPSPTTAPEPSAGFDPAALAAERPELALGAAFAGGLVLAMILKRFAR